MGMFDWYSIGSIGIVLISVFYSVKFLFGNIFIYCKILYSNEVRTDVTENYFLKNNENCKFFVYRTIIRTLLFRYDYWELHFFPVTICYIYFKEEIHTHASIKFCDFSQLIIEPSGVNSQISECSRVAEDHNQEKNTEIL